jgi:hypothetical protein
MLLTKFRENNLRDAITKIDSNLFQDVTGLSIRDFELLMSIGLFNESLMNDSVFKFRRYEDNSLKYSNTLKQGKISIGGFSTTVNKNEFINIE